LNILDCELTRGLIGFGNRPGKSPATQAKGIDLKLKPAQSFVIKLNLYLGKPEFGSEGLISAVEANVLGDDSLVPSQAQAGELKIDATLVQSFEERSFYKTGQADLVNINQATQYQ
jgi:hypothetical protein